VVRKSLILALVMAFAGAAYAANKGKDVTLTGYVIDAACAAKHANDANVADEIKTHSKGCALSAGCVASGYKLYADGKLYTLDKAGSGKVEALLKSTSSEKGLQVKVEGSLDGDNLKVKSIAEVS
jgi:type 1 fimbria pilin